MKNLDHTIKRSPLWIHTISISLTCESHESMTYGVHGIYLKFRSFNGIDPIVPTIIYVHGLFMGLAH
jgi:hypothetical protein